MKTSLTTNWRLPLRALPLFLIAIAGLWAGPRAAHAQELELYVAWQPHGGSTIGVVSKLKAANGEFIKSNFIEGLNEPSGLVLNDNTLFVASSQSGTIGKYNATTGAAISAGFIVGLQNPSGLAVSDNKLFVASAARVGKYDAITGAPINANFITGLRFPNGLAVLDNKLFVGDAEGSKIGKYDATTGAPINASFITFKHEPTFIGLTLSGSILFVANGTLPGAVAKYDAITGAPIDADFIKNLEQPVSLTVFDGRLFVAQIFGAVIGKYNADTGAPINAQLQFPLPGIQAIVLKATK